MAPSSPDGLDFDGRYFEALFAREDPWGYGSDYEQVKYEQTLALLGERRFGSALEIGCAEGRFTERLIGHADRILAIDVSPTALERAEARLAGKPGAEAVRFARHDLFGEELPGRFDLILCSELLGYLTRRQDVERVLARVLRALEPDGLLVMANARAVTDEPDRRGFDWNLPFGARTIAEVTIALGANLHEELAAPLYAVQSFSLREQPDGPRTRSVAMGAIPAELAVAARGLPPRSPRPRGTSIPVLAYHRIATSGPAALAPYRIAPDAFAEQMAFLGEKGYTALSLAQFRNAHVRGLSVPDRSVLLTFDDAYADFAERALPVLEKNGFPATLFVVVDRVGGRADWDAAYGAPAPLLDWEDLREVARRNVAIGSHTRTHPHLPEIPAEHAIAELARSRARIQEELGRPVTALAYPFGESSPLVATWAASCGYELAFTCRDDRCAWSDDRMLLPRILVYPQADVTSFAAQLVEISSSGSPVRSPNSAADGRKAAKAPHRPSEAPGVPFLSVVIPTRDRRELVDALLQSLAANDLARDRYEVLVVSDGSRDGTDRHLEDHWGDRITLLRQESSGAAAARNHGIRHARGEVILLLDDDVLVDSDALEAHLTFHREWPEDHHACLGFMAWPAASADEPFVRYLAESDEYLDWRWVRQRPADDVGWRAFWTGHLSLKRAFLKRYGLFDAERFRGLLGEDLELGERLERAGLKLHFRDSITAWHQKAPSFSEFARRHLRRARSRACFDERESEGISPCDAAGLASERGLDQIVREVEAGLTSRGSIESDELHRRAAAYREALRFADAAGRAPADPPEAEAVNATFALLQSLATLRAYMERELAAKSAQLAESTAAYFDLQRELRQTQEALLGAQAALEDAGRRARNQERELAEWDRRARTAADPPRRPRPR